MNRYPLWKYLLVIVVSVLGILYALPNIYPSAPAVQISPRDRTEVTSVFAEQVQSFLSSAGVGPEKLEQENNSLLLRFSNTDMQLKAKSLLEENFGTAYTMALNLAPSTPQWLRAVNAQPMYLGLDLRGGVHFLMEVDMQAATDIALNRFEGEFRDFLREGKVPYSGVSRKGEKLIAKFKTEADREAGLKVLRRQIRNDLTWGTAEGDISYDIVASLTEQNLDGIRKFALQQNITTLRKRVNELGVAEPIIQQQGRNRIVVQLPGIQDTNRAKQVLGATATLEFRLVDDTGKDPYAAANSGRAPIGTKLFYDRDGQPILLKRQVMLTGEYITDASQSFDQNNQPAVSIVLDGKGAKRFSRVTGQNIQKPMAVVFIETIYEEKEVNGETVRRPKKSERVINVATIQDQLSRNFQITGLDSSAEARDLSLLLRAGALAAPVYIVEERTVGPNLGQENIEKGFLSIQIGFFLVLLFMAVYYRVFGMVAIGALFLNVSLIIAALSILQATLTLPGIAGIVLTIGMAVDANVLIFERVKEELAKGTPTQHAIHQGYAQAFSTIADANITTLIAAMVLYAVGTGPIKGFAITLAIGILSSMFTAIVGSRAVINAIYGGRKVEKLSI